MSRPTLDASSRLLFLLWALLLTAALPGERVWLLLAAVLLFAACCGRPAFRLLTRPRLWHVCLSILALAPFVLGPADLAWGSIRLSRVGLQQGWWMMLRALTLMLASGAALSSLGLSELIELFERANLRGMGFALGVAFNLVGALQDVAAAAYHTIRLRGGFRRPLASIPLFFVTAVSNALRYGDDVVNAALMRAFDPARRPAAGGRAPARGAAWDRLFFAGLVTTGAGLLLIG